MKHSRVDRCLTLGIASIWISLDLVANRGPRQWVEHSGAHAAIPKSSVAVGGVPNPHQIYQSLTSAMPTSSTQWCLGRAQIQQRLKFR